MRLVKNPFSSIQEEIEVVVNEIFYSLQGESSRVGLPTIFIRLTGCPLRCQYCDTEYAFYDGKDMSIDQIMDAIKPMKIKLVEITGGEPMLQANVIYLMQELLNNDYKVLLETSGAIELKHVPKEVKKIVDFKCPSSGMSKHNLWKIVPDLNPRDEIKFVIGDINDYEWVKEKMDTYNMTNECTVLMSPVFDIMSPDKLSKWILDDNLEVRMQIQMHKYIWDPNKTGV